MVDSLRISTTILGLSNLAVVIVGGVLLFPVFPGCDVDRITIPVVMVSLAAAFKIFAMFNSGIAQKATAITILDSPLLILLLLTPLISFEDGYISALSFLCFLKGVSCFLLFELISAENGFNGFRNVLCLIGFRGWFSEMACLSHF